MDQVVIRADKQDSKKGTIVTIYADPKARGYHDLLIKGGQFYAVYNSTTKCWSKDISELSGLIDRDIEAYADSYEGPADADIKLKLMNNMSNGAWMRYLSQLKGLRDNPVNLDQKILFDNDEITRSDYASFKEPYALEPGPIPNYEALMSSIYDPDERRKLEWGIGLLVDGKYVKQTHKFFVICGAPGTGKSTVLHIIEQLFHGYISYFNAEQLGKGYTFATATFKDAPLIAIQTDGDLSHLYDNTAINEISGHETILINEKGVKQYPVDLKTIMFMATNKPVRITDSESGLIRRLIDVYPSNRILPATEYFQYIDGIRYELGGIAAHCLEVFKKMGPNAYGSYVANQMIVRTNDIYSFLSSQLDLFQDGIPNDGASMWRNFKSWCEDSNINVKIKRDEFMYEVGNYFETVTRDIINGRESNRNIKFLNFKWDKFGNGENHTSKVIEQEAPPVLLEAQESKFDSEASDWPAQYAKDDDLGSPQKAWSQVHTTLKDLDTRQLHWVRVPENLIVIDFDLRGADGEKKSLEENIKAASVYPPTYTEVSKSGGGVHLHYYYDGDVSKLKPIVEPHIECKVYKGRSALRRKLTLCNDLDIAHISSGLPLKKDNNMMESKDIQNEQHLRSLIAGNLEKKYLPGTKPSIDFIKKLLDEAQAQHITYNISDMKPAILAFAMNSTHWKSYCMAKLGEMHFRSDEEIPLAVKPINTNVYTFYDVEVFPNLFMICFKDSDKKNISTWINPPAKSIQELCTKNLIGFNNRRYDNHILYAWGWLGYNNAALYQLSADIVNGVKGALFPNAFNLSYTDIYDFAKKKQSLKKWEIELGIDHHELGRRWDQPVPESEWPVVQSYCEDDVRATEAVFNHLHEDFVARLALASLSGLTPNDTSNQHSTKIIVGNEKHPQNEYPFPDLAKTFPGYTFDRYAPKDTKSVYRGEYPGEGGYVWVYGMDNGEGPDYG